MSKRCSFEAPRSDRILEIGVVLIAVAIAAVSARPFTAGANDASRLATVECLVDHHTLEIDQSTWFEAAAGDKIRPIRDGPFYSDKPPVLALLLAGPYAALHDGFGFRSADHKEAFCFLMTLLCSGLAYVAAVWCVYRLGRLVGLSPGWAAALTASFGLATVAPVYARNVNSHLPSLAAAMAVVLNVAGLTRTSKSEVGSRKLGMGRLLLIGLLAGFAYALEQPTGGLLLVAVSIASAVRLRRPTAVVWIALAALPWALMHHAVTWACAGTFGPPNSNPAVFDYPGSWFDAQTLTGRWNHAGLGDFAAYAFLMLFGERGFVLSNPALLLALPAAVWALRRIEIVCFGLWALGVWLVYAALSTNYGGTCCTIRWFTPLLAPAYFVLALQLRDSPRYRIDFIVLSGVGAVLATCFWLGGPFGAFYDVQANPHFPIFFWSVLAAVGVMWAGRRALAAITAARRR
jgi:hypothetical protein